MIKVLCIAGPTASGKTAMAVKLARMLDGEVISCDSMQIYRRMNVGTAKPGAEEMGGVVHHMIDIAEPWENFSCMDFAALARVCAKETASRGKTPIFCGGTGFYLDHILNDTSFSEAEASSEFREKMYLYADQYGVEALHRKLSEIDPESAAVIHKNNIKRVIRAIEIYEQSGIPKSEWDRRSRTKKAIFKPYIAVLAYSDRAMLYDRINRRVDQMFDGGLVSEVESLLKAGDLRTGTTAIQAIGYKELVEYFDGKISIDEAREKIKKNTRNYAKRQMTWFLHHGNAHVFYMDSDDRDTVAKQIFEGFLAE